LSLRRAVPSIRGRLLAWLLGAVLGAGALAGAVVHAVALHEINELFDYHIRQLALSLAAQSMRQDAALVALPDEGERKEFDFAVQIWNEEGDSVYLSPNYPALPSRAVLGFSDVNDSSGEWRVYATQWGSRTIQVVQPLSVRREIAFESALRTLSPLLLVIPLLAATVWATVGRAMRPLRGVVDAVERKGAGALEPLEERGLPIEIAPLVAALNRLLGRLEQSVAAQRSFVGDAAHELRTPLAALRLQAQVLVRAGDEAERRATGDEFVASVDRATHLVEQLLELARSEPDAAPHRFDPVRLDEIARETVAELAGAALARGIDLGLGPEHRDGIAVNGDAQSLRILLRNLVDNAVRYTPAGGRVDVAAGRRDGSTVLSVLDTGPGIAPAERDRVFDRFYRLPGSAEGGSGLGLAIVRRIAELHGAQVRLEAGEAGIGLKASVEFPRQA
jgi:two-component system OmpR family sensor kinase